MAINLLPTEKDIGRIVDAVRQLTQGRSNSVSTVTLRANQTTTVVPWINCGKDSQIFLTAKTPHAAALVPAPYVKTADVVLGSFTITHPSNANTDLTFAFDCKGG